MDSYEKQFLPEINLNQTNKKSKNFKLGALFSSPNFELASTTVQNRQNHRIHNMHPTNNTPIQTSSLITDHTNALRFLANIDTLQLSPIDACNVTQQAMSMDANTPKLLRSLTVRGSLKMLCETMGKQILTRAFYGWLTYHRNLKTVELHLTGLVNDDYKLSGNGLF